MLSNKKLCQSILSLAEFFVLYSNDFQYIKEHTSFIICY
jgi:hypothetical protein